MWDRDNVDFIQSQELAWEHVPPGLFGQGGLRKILSEDLADGAVTELVRVRTIQRGCLRAGADLYALEGDSRLNGQTFGPGHYCHVPPDTEIEFVPGLPRATIYVGAFGSTELGPEPGHGQARLIDLESIPWQPPHWAGDTPLLIGAMMKPVRQDEHGSVYLSGMLPGWTSEDEESHPVTEESFKLFGEIIMGDRGIMHPGAYFFRGPDVFHGPLYTRTGTMSLVRSSGPTTTSFRRPGPGGTLPELIARAWHGAPHPALRSRPDTSP